jgi:hypothetical protein
MKLTHVTLLASAAAFAGLMLAAVPASAYVVCNGGDCWHTEKRFTAPGVTFNWHPDDWYFHQHWDNDHHFHDLHDGRGYWKGGVWIGL